MVHSKVRTNVEKELAEVKGTLANHFKLLQEMFNPNKVYYFFQNAKVNGNFLFEPTTHKLWLNYRQVRSARELELSLLRRVMRMSVTGIVFVFLQLKIIKIQQDIFLLDMKQGRECLIPKAISISEFPESFRYYDPVLSWLQQNIDDHTKHVFNVKK